MSSNNTLQDVATDLLEFNLGATENESLLILTDTVTEHIGRALLESGRNLGLDAGILTILPREQSGQEPPAFASAAMTEADIVVCPASTSFTHTRARELAAESGARVATMPGITEQMFASGAVSADYQRVTELSTKLTGKITEADTATIEYRGEQFTVSLAGRDGISSDGILQNAGDWGNLPSGEAYVAPVEGTANGTLVFDGGIVGGGDSGVITVTVEDGSIVKIEGKNPPSPLVGGPECSRQTCELGIGTNPSAQIVGNVLEDEKVYGTCHVAFGDNKGFGGEIECDSHIDGILLEPTVFIDDERVVEGGEVLI